MTITPARPSLRSSWDRDGYVIVRGLFDPEEISAARRESEDVRERFQKLIDTKNIRCRWQDNVYTGECQFDAFDPIIDLSPICRSLAYDSRLFDLLADLYGEPACLFKDKLIYKLPGAKGYALHQDWIAWDRFPKSFLSLLIPLDPADEENGCTVVYPGYHRNGTLTPADGNYHQLPADHYGRIEGGAPGPGPRRRGRLRRVYPAPFQPEPVRTAAAATLF